MSGGCRGKTKGPERDAGLKSKQFPMRLWRLAVALMPASCLRQLTFAAAADFCFEPRGPSASVQRLAQLEVSTTGESPSPLATNSYPRRRRGRARDSALRSALIWAVQRGALWALSIGFLLKVQWRMRPRLR